ncbi:MAG TPA: hypothetical protein VGF23_03410 [Gaiellaceae bacterium]|jgi:hypothetical protein
MRRRGKKKRSAVLGALAAAEVATAIVARSRGYALGWKALVRCRQGHLFTTIWLPGVSVKSLRLGWWRVQRCPVGRHWTIVHPVKESDLSESERRDAREHRDIRIP